MMRAFTIPIAMACAALLGACGDASRETAAGDASSPGAVGNASAPSVEGLSADAAVAQTTTAATQFPRGSVADTSVTLVIRTGNAQVRVDDVRPAVDAVRALAARLGGYVANSSFQGGRDQVRSATLEVKVPARNYDQAIADLARIGEVEYVNTTAEDVGEEYVDLAARAANSRRLEERLVVLLATRTGRLEDVLAVERELARVREEIERIEGRMRYLRTRAAMSTLTITVHEPEPLHGFSPGDNPIVGAFKRAWRNFVSLVAGLIAALGVIIPLAAVGVVGWYVYRRYGGRFRRNSKP